MELLFSLLASGISLLFAALVLRQYLSRHGIYQLLWAFGLFMFALAAAAEALGSSVAWTEELYRVWFLSGAYFGAVYLGMGSIYLLAPRPLAHGVLAVLVLASLGAIVLVQSTGVDLSQLPQGLSEPLGPPGAPVRLLTIGFNALGSLALVGGGLLSAWRHRAQGLRSSLVLPNLLIAGGALLLALTHSPAKVGVSGLRVSGELVGIAIMFLGFLKSR